MKILLVGNSIIDHMEENSGYNIKPGGIYYSALGANSIADENDSIFILTGWNEKDLNIFNNVYSKINMDYSNKIESLPEVILKTSGEGEREETYINLSTQLSIEKINDWNQFDGILINMITGFDITIDQLNYIKEQFKGIVYFDLHTLSRGVDKNFKREFRPVPDSSLWLKNIDILQTNENELKTISKSSDETETANEILNSGPKILIITKGNKGAAVYYKNHKRVDYYTIDAEKVEAVNKVGCGDIFGAVFFYTYIKGYNVIKSLKIANKAGALAVSTVEGGFKSLSRFLRELIPR